MKRNFRFSIFNFKFLSLVSILILAAFLRLYRIADYMTFLGDEGRDVLVVYNILHGKLTLLGPTSSVGGFFLGPIYYYFMTPFLWLFNYDPVGPAVMVALFGIATVWLVYYVGKEFFNEKVGLVAALLYAISPLIIAYSRSSWNPNPLPFFSLLSLFILYKAINKNSLKLLVLCGILLGIAMQLHYLATFLCAIVFVYVLVDRFIMFSKINRRILTLKLIKEYGSILIGFIIGWSPFLVFEIRHGFLDFRSITNFIFHSGNTGTNANFFLTIYDVFFRLFGRLVTTFPPPEQLVQHSKLLIGTWYFLTLALGIASVFVFLKVFYESYKRKSELFGKYSLLFIWLFLGIILFGFYKKSIYDYYFSFMFPLPFLLVGNFLVSTYNSSFIKGTKILAIVVLLAILILNIRGIPFRNIPNRQLNQMETIAKFVEDKTGGKPFNFAILTGGNSDHAYRYFFTVWNHPPVTIQDDAHDPERKTVTDQLLVVCESMPCSPLGNSLWEIAGFGRAEIVGSWDVSVVKIYKLTHYVGP